MVLNFFKFLKLSGVPQGTVLGPVLFSLYINDITTDIDSEIRLFADDCVCYREIKGTEDTVKLQEDIDRLGCWARKWGMRFQPVKCNIMQITRKRIKKISASYCLEGTILDNVENIKYLGVTITNDLKWNTHVSNICTKANRTLGFLRRNLSACPQDVKDVHKVSGGHFLNSTTAESKYETDCLAKTICQFQHVGFPTHFNTRWNT